MYLPWEWEALTGIPGGLPSTQPALDLGVGVWGLGLGIWGLGSMVYGLRLEVQG